MKKLLTVVLASILTASLGASAIASETATSKNKLVTESPAEQHKDLHKNHKSHKAAKAEKLEKLAPTRENAQ